MSELLWGRLVPAALAEHVKKRGVEPVLNELRATETLCICGQFTGIDDIVLHSPETGSGGILPALWAAVTKLVDAHQGVLAELAEDRFVVLFPRAAGFDKPVGNGFAFVTGLDRECAPLFDDAAQRLYHHPIRSSGEPRRYGIAIGVDLGKLDFAVHEGMLLVTGPALTWARRCMQGEAGAVVVNNSLRWRMAESNQLEPASAVQLYAHHILFREQVIETDGIAFRAYRLARRK